MSLTHLNTRGEAHMVDIADKAETRREATASGRISMHSATLALLADGELPKGDVLATARIAAIQAAKRTHELIPLCHVLALSKVTVDFRIDADNNCVEVIATCRLNGRTGVEMEALTAVSVACLTLYDMCKAVDKDMQIGDIHLLSKKGGKSGDYQYRGNERSGSESAEQGVTTSPAPAASAPIVTGESQSGHIGVTLRPEEAVVRVKYLAELRERLGTSELDVPFASLPSADITGLKAALKSMDVRFAALGEQRVLCAVNQVMGTKDTPLTAGDEVAFFPPVTGG